MNLSSYNRPGGILDFLQNTVICLNSSHILAYNPNAHRAYEKSQHAEDFGPYKK